MEKILEEFTCKFEEQNEYEEGYLINDEADTQIKNEIFHKKLILVDGKLVEENFSIPVFDKWNEDNYKTVRCKKFAKHGYCFYGDKCVRYHTPSDVRFKGSALPAKIFQLYKDYKDAKNLYYHCHKLQKSENLENLSSYGMMYTNKRDCLREFP